MATIGQQLASPESGWKRYDDISTRIKLVGTWSNWVNTICYGGSGYYVNATSVNDKVQFSFYGTKLRVISNSVTDRCTQVTINIDNNTYYYNPRSSITTSDSTRTQRLNFELTNLTLGVHSVTMFASKFDGYFDIDAFDIDYIGYLIHPYNLGIERKSLTDMQIGDYIPCTYVAGTSGAIGTFSNLGVLTGTEIPVTSSATPNGMFYWIKVDKGLLVSDRCVQSSISWDTLNTNGFIEGKFWRTDKSLIPIMTSNTVPSGEAFANQVYDVATYPIYNAFNGKNTTYTDAWVSSTLATTSSPVYIGYDFKIGNVINSYSISATMNYKWNPKDWKFQGSNDGTNWIDLHQVTGEVFTSLGQTKYYDFINETPYQKYRLYVTNCDSANSYFGIGEFGMYYTTISNKTLIRSLSGGCAYADANFTYNNSPTSITTNATNNSATIGNIFNGSPSLATGITLSVLSTNRIYVEFKYASTMTLKGIQLYSHLASNGYEPAKDFTLVGSNDNFATEIVIKTGTNNPVGTDFAGTTILFTDNDKSFTSYRLYIDSWYAGNGGDGQCLNGLKAITNVNEYIKSTVDKGLGAWPISNEWDTHIVNSDLKGKITKGDDNVWHWKSGVTPMVKETPINGIATKGDGVALASANTQRVWRGYYGSPCVVNTFGYAISNIVATSLGFRPVLEYLEPNSKASSLWL
jgi:hypothetical protein